MGDLGKVYMQCFAAIFCFTEKQDHTIQSLLQAIRCGMFQKHTRFKIIARVVSATAGMMGGQNAIELLIANTGPRPNTAIS